MSGSDQIICYFSDTTTQPVLTLPDSMIHTHTPSSRLACRAQTSSLTQNCFRGGLENKLIMEIKWELHSSRSYKRGLRSWELSEEPVQYNVRSSILSAVTLICAADLCWIRRVHPPPSPWSWWDSLGWLSPDDLVASGGGPVGDLLWTAEDGISQGPAQRQQSRTPSG